MSILQKVNSHDDLILLTDSQRAALCDEIREFLVTHVSKTGGHLASNLGVVEVTVALETVFDTRKDRLVFDVGHQSYVHKLLTGRRADFDHLRQFGGMAGFPKPSESRTDAFVAGHASSSVSIALGMARARTLNKADYNVVALIGDGAMTGGMAYEGLNDAAYSREPMVIILNDNEMSIDRNVGGMSRHLSKLRTKEHYLGIKRSYRSLMNRIPGGKVVYRATSHVKRWLKRALLPSTMFENIGLTYLGPVDGHNLKELIRLLRAARDMKEPVLLHVVTQKGHGYLPAEEHPSKFHGIGKFDPITGKVCSAPKYTFSDAFGDTMLHLAAKDKRVCAITAAMPGGTGLLKFKDKYPKRLFDVGIAEEHAVSMAGGLAKQGLVPVVALYSTFLQRAYDQIMQDVAMLHLHVVLAVDRAGLVGEDGETHHGIYDIGFLGQAPGMQILCPASCAELADMLQWAVAECSGPVAVRYPRGADGLFRGSCWHCAPDTRKMERVFCHRRGPAAAIITYGTLINNALEAAGILEAEGISVMVLRLMSVSPLDADAVSKQLEDCPYALIAEEAASGSGIHEKLAWALRQRKPACRVDAVDLGGQFVTHGSMEQLYRQHHLDGEGLAARIREAIGIEG